jgi:Protein of unknown function (DUF4236)
MGLRYRKSLKLAPGVRLNFAKRATSLAIDGKGLTLNLKKGIRTKVGRLGRRTSFSLHRAYTTKRRVQPQNAGSENPMLAMGLVFLAMLSVVAMVAW